MSKKFLTFAILILTSVMPLAAFAQTTTSALSPRCPSFTQSLYRGLSGTNVTSLQEYLTTTGYFGVQATGYFGPITEAAVARWQADGGVVGLGEVGSGIFGPLSRAYLARTCSGGKQTGIEQINAPATVSLSTGNIAEIRNENAYFTLTSLTATSATITLTPVGCWNSFPSDPPPKIVCMIAVIPTPPQTLAVGEMYNATKYSITLTSILNGVATFSVSANN